MRMGCMLSGFGRPMCNSPTASSENLALEIIIFYRNYYSQHFRFISSIMSADRVRPTKLKFKGEKTKKKRKREDDDAEGSSSRRKRKDDDDESPEAWVLPENPNEIRGPTFIVHPSDPSPISVNYDSTRGRIVLHSLDRDKTDDSAAPTSVLERVPTEVPRPFSMYGPTRGMERATKPGLRTMCMRWALPPTGW